MRPRQPSINDEKLTYFIHGKPVTQLQLLAYLVKERERRGGVFEEYKQPFYKIGDFYYSLDEFIQFVVDHEKNRRREEKLHEEARRVEKENEFTVGRLLILIGTGIYAIGYVIASLVAGLVGMVLVLILLGAGPVGWILLFLMLNSSTPKSNSCC